MFKDKLTVSKQAQIFKNSLDNITNVFGDSLQKIQQDTAQQVKEKKLFISEIDDQAPDSLISSILQQCGELKTWKRAAALKGNKVKFGIAEYNDIEGVINCVRILQGFKVFGKKLKINVGTKTKQTVANFFKNQSEQIKGINDQERYSKIIEKLSMNDQKKQEKIDLILQQFQQNKDKIVKDNSKTFSEKYTDEKLESQKRKYGLVSQREFDEQFENELRNFLQEEQDWFNYKKKIRYEQEDLKDYRNKLIDQEYDFDELTYESKMNSLYQQKLRENRWKEYQKDKEILKVKNRVQYKEQKKQQVQPQTINIEEQKIEQINQAENSQVNQVIDQQEQNEEEFEQNFNRKNQIVEYFKKKKFIRRIIFIRFFKQSKQIKKNEKNAKQNS